MNREMVRVLAYGQYVFTNLQGTIDKDKMQEHVNGALWLFDLLNRKGAINCERMVSVLDLEYQNHLEIRDV